MMFQPYAIHIAVSASNKIDVLLETSGAASITPITPSVAARRTIGGDNGRAATIARAIPTRKMSKFTGAAVPLTDQPRRDAFRRSCPPPLRGSLASVDKDLESCLSAIRGGIGP